MPIHNHECEHCGRRETVHNLITEEPEWPECCSDVMPRVYDKPFNTGIFSTPIEMFSIAMNTDEEIKAFKQACPGVAVSLDQNDENYGIPVATTRQEKMQALKAAGYEECN